MANRYVNQRITADIVPMDESEDPDEGPMFQVPLLKRNLLGDFGRPSIIEPPVSEHMKVFLRIRPFSEEETHKKENQGCLTIESDRTVVTHAPKESNYYKNSVRGYGKTTTKFTFSHIFGQNTTQKEFFNDTMLGLVKDFIDGQNCLVFSYGVTSSGKTYTIQGLPKDAGVLPRALDVLFNSINGRQWEGMNLKPEMFTNVTRLTSEQELVEQKIKERVMKLSCTDDVDVMSLLGDDASDVSIATNTTTCSESSNVSTMDNKDSLDGGALFEELDDRVREEAMVSVETQGQIKFSVWVSFAEIYNEQIYDLLEPLPKKKNARRTCLKVSDDQNGSPYIKGLKYINVNSADEAYKLLTIGQRNLKTACTKLNHNSSRSHCIFNIKILRLVDKEDPHVARVSTLTLCDLAGSERYSKTQNTGERLKEAGNINTSLLTLGRCIETLKYNQTHKDHTRIIPFRESKLTRLFQNYFVGRGKAAMFVNVNQCASMFDETQHVFKFSAIASQVVVQQKPVFFKPKLPQIVASPNPIPRASISWATPARSKVPRQQDAENIPLPDEDDDDEDLDGTSTYTQQNIDELLGIIEQLQGSLEQEMRSKAKLESQIRKEVCEEMMKQFIEIEEQCGEQIRIREQMAEELAEKRMQILIEAERAKRRKGETMTDEDDEWVSSVTLHQEKVKVEQRDDTIKNQENEIETLNKKISEMLDNQDKLQKEKQNLQKQLEDSEVKITSVDSVDNKLMTDLEELRKTITEYEGKVEKLEKELSQKSVVTEDAGKADLIENLSQQITQTRQQVKEQETEIRELNDMLTEAGETFQQKEMEINKLTELVQEYEKKLETQCEAIKVLERAASDSKVAMETADQSLSKREDCVTSLQTDIRNLEGDVSKYRNKARFFEDQLVEKEQASVHWKTKYEIDREEHAKSQAALIHGFTAEISNLKSQIFHFKSQLYGVKSPLKSPGGSLKSPSAKMRLFSMLSPSKSPQKDSEGNNSIHVMESPAVKVAAHDSKEHLKHDVNEQLKALQREMDKNCAMIAELEHALQISKSAVEDLEKKLNSESANHTKARNRVEELESQLKQKDTEKLSCAEMKQKEDVDKQNSFETKLQEKIEELNKANLKIKELEPLMKDYFSTAKKLTDSETKVKHLTEVIEDKSKEIADLDNRFKQLEKSNKKLSSKLHENEETIVKIEERKEELECLNGGLKEMVNKTTRDLETKEIELQILSPKSVEKLQKCADDKVENSNNDLQSMIDNKNKDLEKAKSKLTKLKEGFKAKDEFLREASEKCKDLEFRVDEKDIENQDLKKELEDSSTMIEKLQLDLNAKVEELVKTGEELAILSMDAETSRRLVTEFKAERSKHTEENKAMNEKLNKTLKEKEELVEVMNNKDEAAKELIKLKEKLNEAGAKVDELQKMLNVVIEKNAELEEKNAKLDDILKKSKQFEDILNDRDKIIDSLSEKIKTIKAEKEDADKNLRINSDNEVEKLKATIKEKDEEIEMFSQNLNAMLEERESVELVQEKQADMMKKLTENEQRNKENEEKLKDRVECQEHDTVSLQEKNLEQENLINQLQNKIESMSKDAEANDDLEESVQDLESAVVDKEVELCQKDKLIEEKNEDILKLENELKSVREKVSECEKDVAAKQKEFDEKLRNQLSDKEKDIEEQKKMFEESVSKKEKDLDDKNVKISELKEELEKTDEKIEDLENLVAKHKYTLEEMEAKLESSQSELTNLDSRLTESFDKNCDLEDALEDKTKQLDELRICNEELKEKIGDSSNCNSSQLSAVLLENAELKSTVSSHKTLHHNVKGELQDARLEVENSRGEIEILKLEIQKKNSQMEDAQNQLVKAKCEIESVRVEIDSKQVQLKDVEHQLGQCSHEIEALREENNTRSTEREETQRQLAAVRAMLDADEVLGNVSSIESIVADLKDQVKIKIKDVDEKKRALHEKTDKTLEELKSVIREKDQEVKSMGEKLHEKDQKIKELEERSQEANSSKTKMDAHNEEVKNEIDAMNLKLKSQNEDLLKMKDEHVNEVKILKLKIEESENENRNLKEENIEMKSSSDLANELRSRLTLKEVESETLKLELKVLKDDLSKEVGQCKVIKDKLQELQTLYESEENDKSNMDCDNTNSEKLKELERKLEAEKAKTKEYQKILEDTGEMKCLSPQTGVRKLRKEKIETENALLEAKFEITSLETKVKTLQANQNHSNYNKTTQNSEHVPSHDPLLQRKLNNVVSKLHETETTNKSLIKEVTELQGTVGRLERRLEEERDRNNVPCEADIHRRSRASFIQAADPRQSISSPSTKVELTKSRDREHRLHEQLTKANVTIQEWLGKLSDTENKLQQKTQELKHAQDTIHVFEVRSNMEGKHADNDLQEYMDKNNALKLQILKKEGEVDELKRKLEADIVDKKSHDKVKEQNDAMVSLLKETLEDQENMLQVQEDFINNKEAELALAQTEYKELLGKYQALLESKDMKQRERLDETKSAARTEAERDLLKQQLVEAEQKAAQALKEKEKLTSIVKENNQELKEMERSLTEARRECEDLRSQGADKCAETRLAEVRRDMETTISDLHVKVRTLQCENKEVNFKLSATQEKLKASTEDKHSCDNKLKEFREERDKLVSGLEAVLKKKDAELKQHKDTIKQLKEKEIQITKSWQEERNKIAEGLGDLQQSRFHIKTEPVSEDNPSFTSPSKQVKFQETEHELSRQSSARKSSHGRPPRPAPPKSTQSALVDTPDFEKTEIQTLNRSPGSTRHSSRALQDTPVLAQTGSSHKRAPSRRGKKRNSPGNRGDDLPPLPKRRSLESGAETSMMSEMSDDYSSHIQIDATPSVAAKNLKKMRKKTSSTLDLSKTEETETTEAPKRPQRSAKRSAKSRILESFRESPMGKTSKRILDNIAETFSPNKSPTKSPKKEDNISTDKGGKRSRQSSKENVPTGSLGQQDKKPRGRGSGNSRGRHKLYKEDTYISEPFENTTDFIQQSPDDIHQTVTRSLRSRRH